ncbi:hypothetical protein PROFUN_09106 [Planoprotostelium fungivorum]|uniref:Uncharacterized protein n=1 Tax=Planoprotostelium fungivorum TaxID=1890364 RepID=A0A2P6NHY9_9EUKA|nr:hypothetical protein PROFUN_09106 [Planoprotostelium fungivorum]
MMTFPGPFRSVSPQKTSAVGPMSFTSFHLHSSLLSSIKSSNIHPPNPTTENRAGGCQPVSLERKDNFYGLFRAKAVQGTPVTEEGILSREQPVSLQK